MAGAMIGSGRNGGRNRYRPLSEINVTPLVDVMLVLLVVFMITAPLLTVGVPVDLPKTEAARMTEQVEPLVITINAKNEVFLQETLLERHQLVPRLRAVTGIRPDTRIFVRGDRTIAYGEVMAVMGQVSAAGFSKVALIAELPRSQEGSN